MTGQAARKTPSGKRSPRASPSTSSAATAASNGWSRDFPAIAEAYARDVVAKRTVACKWTRLACKRHLDDLKRQRWGYRFDEWHSGDVCDFIEKLPHVQGTWDTSNITLEPPQIFILAVVFGWRRKADGGRRFSTVYIEMARKGAKSTLTSGVCLYCACCEDEPGAEVVIGATTGAQAGKVFLPARSMVQRSSDLRDAFGVGAWARSITVAETGATIQPINAKGATQDGWNPHLAVLDELHAHKDRALFDVMTSARGARRNRLVWMITTAGFNLNGVCYEQRTYLTKVLEKVFSAEHFFGIIFTLDEGDDPFDERVWAKANPLMPVTPALRDLQEAALEARASPSSEGNFKTKNLNVWQNAAGSWLSPVQWRACADPTLSWDDFDGLECWIGGDLADKDDICALALIAYDADGCLLIKTRFWLPEAVLNHPDHVAGRGVAPYRLWTQGEDPPLRKCEGDWVDHNEIEKQVREWQARYGARRATFDQFAAALAMASRMNQDLGDPDDPFAVVLNKSAANVTDPAKELEARVKGGLKRVRHDDNPVMNWMASNVVVSRYENGTILPKKESKMSPNKIDGVDAVINAMAPTVVVDETAGPSVYETRGIIEIELQDF